MVKSTRVRGHRRKKPKSKGSSNVRPHLRKVKGVRDRARLNIGRGQVIGKLEVFEQTLDSEAQELEELLEELDEDDAIDNKTFIEASKVTEDIQELSNKIDNAVQRAVK